MSEAILNGHQAADLSVQQRTDEAMDAVFQLWFGRKARPDQIRPWWSYGRDIDLRSFAKTRGNDILQGAIASIVKKFVSMNWVLEGPEPLVREYRARLLHSEYGQGWDSLISKWVEEYITQDKGVHVEVIGTGNPAGPVLEAHSLAILDSLRIVPTSSITYPALYKTPKTIWDEELKKKRRITAKNKLHTSRVIRMVDQPAPDEEMNGVGFCTVSRVIDSSEILLALSRYKSEKLSDLPPTGLLLLNNILEKNWNKKTEEYDFTQQQRGNQVFKSLLTLIGLDPTRPVTAQLLEFSSLPDHFNEQETISTYINILALAFGVDAREFWPIAGGPMGSAMETTIQHTKARGKGIGSIVSQIEEAINLRFLPSSVTFRFDFVDDEQDAQAAEIVQRKVETIMSMWKPAAPGQVTSLTPPVSREEIRQMLLNEVPYFKEDFIVEHVPTEDPVLKSLGRWCVINKTGAIRYERRQTKYADLIGRLRNNDVTLEGLANYVVAEMLD